MTSEYSFRSAQAFIPTLRGPDGPLNENELVRITVVERPVCKRSYRSES